MMLQLLLCARWILTEWGVWIGLLALHTGVDEWTDKMQLQIPWSFFYREWFSHSERDLESGGVALSGSC